MPQALSPETLSSGVDLLERFSTSLVPYASAQENSFSENESFRLRVAKLEEAMEFFNRRAQNEEILADELEQLKSRISSLEASNLFTSAETGAAAAPVEMNTTRSTAEDINKVDDDGLTTDRMDAVLKEIADIKDWREQVETMPMYVGPEPTKMIRASGTKLDASSHELDQAIRARVTYEWETSVYDGLLVIFMPSLGIGAKHSFALFCGFVLNLIMAAITFWIVGGDEFTDEDKFSADSAREWREGDGHSESYVDSFTQRTLVYRVCSRDRALSMATTQWNLKHEIDKYQEGVSQGLLLCTLAVILWELCCVAEIRKAIEFCAALWKIPRTEFTELGMKGDNHIMFKGLAPSRLVLGTALALLRAAVAILIMYQGARWLARTTSIENLLLNASALGFVLDIDNIIFHVLAPSRVSGLIKNLTPGKLPELVLIRFLPAFLMTLIFVFLLWIHLNEIADIQSQMDAWNKAACEPEESRGIAMGFNAMGWILYADTMSDTTTNVEVATNEHVLNIVEDLVYRRRDMSGDVWHIDDFYSVQYFANANFEDMETYFSCVDNNTLEGGTVGNRLWAASGIVGFKNVQSCAQIADSCYDPGFLGQNVRFLCARTCGCSDPTSGLWDLGKSMHGCPNSHCQKRLRGKMRNPSMQCVDMNKTYLASHAGWRHLWSRLNVSRTIAPEAVYNMSILGCEAIRYFEYSRARDVCSLGEVWHVKGGFDQGAAPFCPESCRCGHATAIRAESDCPGLCPQTCCHGYDYVRF